MELITYIAKTEAGGNSLPGQIAIPSVVRAGDCLVLVGHRINNGAFQTVSGWATWLNANGLLALRTADGSEAGTTVALTGSNSGAWRALVLVYRNARFVGRPAAGAINAGGSRVVCSSTMLPGDGLYIGLGGLEGAAARTFTFPAAATVRSDIKANSNTLFAFDEPAAPNAIGLHPQRDVLYTGADVVNDRGHSVALANAAVALVDLSLGASLADAIEGSLEQADLAGSIGGGISGSLGAADIVGSVSGGLKGEI